MLWTKPFDAGLKPNGNDKISRRINLDLNRVPSGILRAIPESTKTHRILKDHGVRGRIYHFHSDGSFDQLVECLDVVRNSEYVYFRNSMLLSGWPEPPNSVDYTATFFLSETTPNVEFWAEEQLKTYLPFALRKPEVIVEKDPFKIFHEPAFAIGRKKYYTELEAIDYQAKCRYVHDNPILKEEIEDQVEWLEKFIKWWNDRR